MKSIIIVFIVALRYILLANPSDAKYPDYESVVTKFYKTHTFQHSSQKTFLRLEKRPNGWHTLLIKYDPEPRILHTALFWDAQQRTFISANLESSNSINWSEAPRLDPVLNHEFDKECYRTLPYYGYTGWDMDLIKAYETRPSLNDTLLLALAFAYSVHSSNLLNNNSGFSDSTLQFRLVQGKNCLSKAQLKQYRKYRHQARDTYRKIYKRNPAFETTSGSIYNRMSNEYLIGFLELRIYQNEKEAQKELMPGLYTDFVRAYAKNLLTACDSNAILFTGTDIDTYPLLYVQGMYGLRTDVSIVNLSLLNTNRYILSLNETILKAPALPLSFSIKQLEAPELHWIHLQDKQTQALSPAKLIDHIGNSGNIVNGMYSYPGNSFILTHGTDTIRWTIEKPYISKSEALMLDIVTNNNWQRPIHISALLNKHYHLGLNPFFQNLGLLQSLHPHRSNYRNLDSQGYVNAEKLYTLLLKRMQWDAVLHCSQYEKSIVSLHRYTFNILCKQLIIENKISEAKEVLEFCERLFPAEKAGLDQTALYFIENHYRLNQQAKGNVIARDFIAYQKSQPTDETHEAIRSYLRSFFSVYQQEEMLNILEE